MSGTANSKESQRQRKFLESAKRIVDEKAALLSRPLTFHVTTFGCQMNAHDSEKLVGMLEMAGFVESDDENCDFVIYNTCTVRENANNKVYGRLGYLHGYKKQNPTMKIALCGCMMQEDVAVERIKKSYPFVDLIFGTFNVYKFPELMLSVLESDRQIIDIWDEQKEIVEDLPSERKYSFKAGVNIMFGCNNFCTYCIVPYVRGRERSRNPYDIKRECEKLVSDGVKEIMLLGQNVNSYGRTLENEFSFAELLDEIAQIKGLERIRFMTSHPKDLKDELIDVMAAHENIARHFHLPLQSGSDTLLKKMNRHYTKGHYIELVEKLREKMPDISITTDIIVGFPGETEEDFLETCDVVKRARYDSAFTFIYSKRSGTPAAEIADDTPEEVIKERFGRLLNEIKEISAEQSRRFVGRCERVLIEHINDQDEGLVTGRMESNLLVHLPGDEGLIGQMADVRIEESKGFYFLGSRVQS